MYKVRKLYYDKVTGEIIWNVSYNQEIDVDFDRDYDTVGVLNERRKDSLALIVLKDGEFAGDFAESNGVRVNIETGKLEFSLPDPNEPELPPLYVTPLSTRVDIIEAESFNNMMAIAEVFEESMKNESENLDTMLAVSELYEIIIDLQRQIDKLKPEIGAN